MDPVRSELYDSSDSVSCAERVTNIECCVCVLILAIFTDSHIFLNISSTQDPDTSLLVSMLSAGLLSRCNQKNKTKLTQEGEEIFLPSLLNVAARDRAWRTARL